MDTETIFKGRVFTVEKVTVELPNDKRANREIVRHTGGAAIVALDEDNNIYVVRQFRTALNKVILEIPAGKLEQGEDPYECAKRELLEETGLAAKNMELLLKMNTSPGYCSELLYIYIATGLTQSNPHYDVDEFLTCEKMPVDSLTDMVYSGEITDGKSIAGILAARKFIQRI
ncbi:MAG: NUDIX hydrolase [Clostridiales bacterium]|nr:NUDIX hydrolase [Clostridiales bacterium]